MIKKNESDHTPTALVAKDRLSNKKYVKQSTTVETKTKNNLSESKRVNESAKSLGATVSSKTVGTEQAKPSRKEVTKLDST